MERLYDSMVGSDWIETNCNPLRKRIIVFFNKCELGGVITFIGVYGNFFGPSGYSGNWKGFWTVIYDAKVVNT